MRTPSQPRLPPCHHLRRPRRLRAVSLRLPLRRRSLRLFPRSSLPPRRRHRQRRPSYRRPSGLSRGPCLCTRSSLHRDTTTHSAPFTTMPGSSALTSASPGRGALRGREGRERSEAFHGPHCNSGSMIALYLNRASHSSTHRTPGLRSCSLPPACLVSGALVVLRACCATAALPFLLPANLMFFPFS